MRNIQASSNVYLDSTPPAPRLIRNTSLLTLMQEKLQPKLQPPATPENLEKRQEDGQSFGLCFLSFQLSLRQTMPL